MPNDLRYQKEQAESHAAYISELGNRKDESVPSEKEEDAAVQAGGQVLAPQVPTTDKRRIATRPAKDPVDVLVEKVFGFLIEQPEFWIVLGLSRADRKRLEKAIPKLMTRVPHMKKLVQ